MRRLLAMLVLPLMLASTPSLALAEHGSGGSGSGSNVAETSTTQSGSQDSTSDSSKLPELKTRAKNEINRRLGALSSLENIVKNSKCLSASDKAKIEAEIQAEQTALPTVKTEIDNDSDTTTEQEHVGKVKDEFKNFALVVPKVHLLRVADRLTCAITKVTAYADRLQTNLDAAKTAGKDVTVLQTTMTDMRTQLKTASDDLTAAKDKIINTTPDQFAADKTIVSGIRDQLNAARQAVIKALKDGNQIRDGLKTLNQV